MIFSQKTEQRIVAKEVDDTFTENYDVIIVGLGTAGSMALITAARRGLRVLGIERLCCMGGMSVAGGIFGCYFGSDGGVYEEMNAKAELLKDVIYAAANKSCAEGKKYVLEQEAIRAGAEIWYEASFSGIFMEDKRVIGLRVLYQHKQIDMRCKVLIDATGDGYVCEAAGATGTFGRDFDDMPVPFSNVKIEDLGGYVRSSYNDNGWCNQYRAENLSKAILSSCAAQLKERYTDEDNHLMYLAPILGIREGKLIKGEDTVTLSDYLADKVTDKPVMYAYADVDKHGIDTAFESETFKDWYVAANLGAVNISVPIPLGVFIPKGFKGLIVTGRCLSVDHDMANCVRMIRDMYKTGEIVGTVAWLSIKNNCELKEIPYKELSDVLKETGCLSEANNKGYRVDAPHPVEPPKSVVWLRDTENIKAALSSDKPGIAIWSCKLLKEKILPDLINWMSDKNENLAKHSAIALGLLDRNECMDVLKNIITKADSFILKDCRKNNQLRCVIAIYLAGRLQCASLIKTLVTIIQDADGYSKSVFSHECSGFKTYARTRFELLSHSVMSSIQIGNAHEDVRSDVTNVFKAALCNNTFSPVTSKKEEYPNEAAMYDIVKNAVNATLEKWK